MIKEMSLMRLMLFFGSGISYISELPNVDKITKELLHGKWHSHTDQNFYPGDAPNHYFELGNLVPRLQKFLSIVMKTTGDLIENPTYEDYFYLVQQIAYYKLQEIDNPAIFRFVQALEEKTRDLYESTRWEQSVNLKLLAIKSCDFIQCVVWHLLQKPVQIDGLTIIGDLHKYGLKFDIATLNHDLLVERYLSDNHIGYFDGFGEPDGDIRYFKPKRFNQTEDIRLYKLHGSINWFRYRKSVDSYLCLIGNDYMHCRDARGRFIEVIDQIPKFLTGSYNKMTEYGFGIIAWMHFKFFEQLYKCNTIIMSGYGWNDRGISGQLMHWLLSSKKNRIILLHENPEDKIKKNPAV